MTTTVSSRTHSWAPQTLPSPEMSGLDFLQALLDGKIPPPPIAGTLGFTLVHVEPGVAVFEGETGEHQYNPMGSIHGGYFATLLDSALGCAVMTRLPAGRAYTTTQLGVHMVRPAFSHTGTLRCEATAMHVGRTVATAEARLTGVADGKLYAHGTTTCAVFPIAQ
ncbi:PaaI family thioesterase [Microbispora corallina]|uniref:Aromatic compound catabolic protein n=1 Tax=Microbispora corallina TaxID=83302 RepID=A0ABQ4G108_9ACTN|nr:MULTISPECIES: PaaI family thioesterase [Microbispora]ETK30656.1 thioesterase [Microbispora sp. ATCC PTA-5024]GIH40759.1 aromatic compound catabolic protein [Microbispora corallina]